MSLPQALVNIIKTQSHFVEMECYEHTTSDIHIYPMFPFIYLKNTCLFEYFYRHFDLEESIYSTFVQITKLFFNEMMFNGQSYIIDWQFLFDSPYFELVLDYFKNRKDNNVDPSQQAKNFFPEPYLHEIDLVAKINKNFLQTIIIHPKILTKDYCYAKYNFELKPPDTYFKSVTLYIEKQKFYLDLNQEKLIITFKIIETNAVLLKVYLKKTYFTFKADYKSLYYNVGKTALLTIQNLDTTLFKKRDFIYNSMDKYVLNIKDRSRVLIKFFLFYFMSS